MRRVALMSTLLAVAACSGEPLTSRAAPDQDLPRASGSPESFGMRILPPTGPRGVLLAMVPDPGDPNTITYTFDDVPYNCYWDNIFPNPHDDLTFSTTPYWAPCYTPNGTMGFIPANSFGWTFAFQQYEVRVTLPFTATSVSLDSYAYSYAPGSMIGYDAAGTAIASVAFTDPWSYYNGVETKTLAAAGIKQVGFLFYQNVSYMDNLKIKYSKDPTDKDQCKDGGWEAYGFKNQGQCVRFVETGKDSRSS